MHAAHALGQLPTVACQAKPTSTLIWYMQALHILHPDTTLTPNPVGQRCMGHTRRVACIAPDNAAQMHATRASLKMCALAAVLCVIASLCQRLPAQTPPDMSDLRELHVHVRASVYCTTCSSAFCNMTFYVHSFWGYTTTPSMTWQSEALRRGRPGGRTDIDVLPQELVSESEWPVAKVTTEPCHVSLHTREQRNADASASCFLRRDAAVQRQTHIPPCLRCRGQTNWHWVGPSLPLGHPHAFPSSLFKHTLTCPSTTKPPTHHNCTTCHGHVYPSKLQPACSAAT